MRLWLFQIFQIIVKRTFTIREGPIMKSGGLPGSINQQASAASAAAGNQNQSSSKTRQHMHHRNIVYSHSQNQSQQSLNQQPQPHSQYSQMAPGTSKTRRTSAQKLRTQSGNRKQSQNSLNRSQKKYQGTLQQNESINASRDMLTISNQVPRGSQPNNIIVTQEPSQSKRASHQMQAPKPNHIYHQQRQTLQSNRRDRQIAGSQVPAAYQQSVYENQVMQDLGTVQTYFDQIPHQQQQQRLGKPSSSPDVRDARDHAQFQQMMKEGNAQSSPNFEIPTNAAQEVNNQVDQLKQVNHIRRSQGISNSNKQFSKAQHGDSERTRQPIKYMTNSKLQPQSAPISPRQFARMNNSQEHITTTKILDSQSKPGLPPHQALNQRGVFSNNANNTIQGMPLAESKHMARGSSSRYEIGANENLSLRSQKSLIAPQQSLDQTGNNSINSQHHPTNQHRTTTLSKDSVTNSKKKRFFSGKLQRHQQQKNQNPQQHYSNVNVASNDAIQGKGSMIKPTTATSLSLKDQFNQGHNLNNNGEQNWNSAQGNNSGQPAGSMFNRSEVIQRQHLENFADHRRNLEQQSNANKFSSSQARSQGSDKRKTAQIKINQNSQPYENQVYRHMSTEQVNQAYNMNPSQTGLNASLNPYNSIEQSAANHGLNISQPLHQSKNIRVNPLNNAASGDSVGLYHTQKTADQTAVAMLKKRVAVSSSVKQSSSTIESADNLNTQQQQKGDKHADFNNFRKKRLSGGTIQESNSVSAPTTTSSIVQKPQVPTYFDKIQDQENQAKAQQSQVKKDLSQILSMADRNKSHLQRAQSDAHASINQDQRPKTSEKYNVSIKVQSQAQNAPRRNNMAPFSQQIEDKASRSQEPIETISPSVSKKSGQLSSKVDYSVGLLDPIQITRNTRKHHNSDQDHSQGRQASSSQQDAQKNIMNVLQDQPGGQNQILIHNKFQIMAKDEQSKKQHHGSQQQRRLRPLNGLIRTEPSKNQLTPLDSDANSLDKQPAFQQPLPKLAAGSNIANKQVPSTGFDSNTNDEHAANESMQHSNAQLSELSTQILLKKQQQQNQAQAQTNTNTFQNKRRSVQGQKIFDNNLHANKQQREALQAVLRAATQNKFKGTRTTPATQQSSPREPQARQKIKLSSPKALAAVESLSQSHIGGVGRDATKDRAKEKPKKTVVADPNEEVKSTQSNEPVSVAGGFQSKRGSIPLPPSQDPNYQKLNQLIATFAPKQRPTSPNTPHLNTIKPKNVVKKFAFATRVGFEPGNPDKVNQDAFILAPNIQERQSMHMFGICDGHGAHGREASNFVKFTLHMQVEQRFPKEGSETYEGIQKCLLESFSSVQQSLSASIPSADYSGTTACVLIVHGHKLITASVGNSRSICVNKFRQVRTLTEDHVPGRAGEKNRVESLGGRISKAMQKPIMTEESAVSKEKPLQASHLTNRSKEGDTARQKLQAQFRVFANENDMTGLHLTRSLGDNLAHKVGVISEPEIKHFLLEDDDQILIMASDGIWDLMSVQNVAQIAQAHYEAGQAEAAANAIVRRATQLWKDKEDFVDDITCVIIFLERKLIQKNVYTKPQLKLIEEEEVKIKELEEQQKKEKKEADEQAQLMGRRRRGRSGSSSRSNSRSPSPGDVMETEKFTELTSKDPIKPALQRQNDHQSHLLEDILNEQNIIQEDDEDIFTTYQTQLKTQDQRLQDSGFELQPESGTQTPLNLMMMDHSKK